MEADDADLEALIAHVRDERGFDFSGYKRASLGRRVHKRVAGLGLDGFADYRDHLSRHPEEYPALFDVVLINVTSFYRDPETWSVIERELIPLIVSSTPDDQPIRVWSAACATGEEAYTAAMVLCDVLGEAGYRDRVKVYATDLDAGALDIARHGRYPIDRIKDAVPHGALDTYFERDGDQATFRKDLRRSMIFGHHDLTTDPPIGHIDLLLCRNALMYFTPAGQEEILG